MRVDWINLLAAITAHHGMSKPTCRYSIRYCIRPDGHHVASPRASNGGSPTHCVRISEASGSGTGFSGKKSRTISLEVLGVVETVASGVTAARFEIYSFSVRMPGILEHIK